MDEKFISHRLTELRLQKNISERQMSLDLGHSPSYINGLATGKMPSVPELLYICEYLGTTPTDFFNEVRRPTLRQQQAIDYIYEMNDMDVALMIGFFERIRNAGDKK